MRIALLTPRYPPILAGAETYARELANRLLERGHTVCVLAGSRPPDGVPEIVDEDGVRVERQRATPDAVGRALREFRPDAVLCQLETTARNARIAKHAGVRAVAAILHGAPGWGWIVANGGLPHVDLFVFNAKDSTTGMDRPLDVVPHCFLRPVFNGLRVANPFTDPRLRDRVTLVNLNPDKGGHVLRDLAIRHPQRRFLGVRGGYGPQHTFPAANVDYTGPTEHMALDVFAATRVLLMPSTQESFGLAAVEAQANGIPVIASDLPSLRDSLGDGALFCPLFQTHGPIAWDDALARLDDPVEYARVAAAARANAERHQREFEAELDGLEERLARIGAGESLVPIAAPPAPVSVAREEAA